MDKINTKYNYILLESISQGMSLSDQRETIIGSNFVILPLYTYYYLVYYTSFNILLCTIVHTAIVCC